MSFKYLSELTNQDTGIVVYSSEDGPIKNGIVCNWASTPGYPISLGSVLINTIDLEIPEIAPETFVESIHDILKDVQMLYHNDEDLTGPGRVFKISGRITLIAPKDWN